MPYVNDDWKFRYCECCGLLLHTRENRLCDVCRALKDGHDYPALSGRITLSFDGGDLSLEWRPPALSESLANDVRVAIRRCESPGDAKMALADFEEELGWHIDEPSRVRFCLRIKEMYRKVLRDSHLSDEEGED